MSPKGFEAVSADFMVILSALNHLFWSKDAGRILKSRLR
ncbi:hypothetical protein PPEP_a2470 [Pseudoalteromonas peptidolytica F12-50-A1]|uniref:Uncharacterized protein n=1 Tax=Pseudoalteromonas peptidolytica F12-50-A1 TaxID=1315280 RepID=A0A8I0T1R8_9GAMM|nr:hypothetical protein [Pseudoalteromonas peptidolytica F12-50-A1]